MRSLNENEEPGGGPVVMDRALEILVVDDDEIDGLAVRRAFAKAHMTNPIRVAGDPGAALAMLRAQPRTLVLLDLDMPRAHGTQLLRMIRTDPALRSTIVVALTTSSEDRDRIEALELGVAGYLPKPITFGAFADVMVGLGKSWTLGEL